MSTYSNNLGKKRRDVSIDRISTMPAVILCHILSFLPTLEAVATMLVSRKFQTLWKNITTLRFCYSNLMPFPSYQHLMRFVHFVNRVFLVLEKESIDNFSIGLFRVNSMHNDILGPNLLNWIAAAISRNVKTFELMNCYGHWEPNLWFQLPSSIFSCRSLEILDISRCVVMLKNSSLACLPNLRILRLIFVKFASNESLEKLISGCPSLHIFYMRRTLDDNMDRFSICSTTLEHLDIASLPGSASSHREMGGDDSLLRLIIDTPALKYLKLDQVLFKNFSIKTSTSLIKAEISLGAAVCKIETFDHLIEALSRVKHLRLNVTDNWLVSPVHSLVWPMFLNLTSLTISNFSNQLDILKDLLHCSSALETLVLMCSSPSKNNGLSKSDVVPRSISPCLETVEFENFDGTSDQLKSLEYILLNAGLLKKMTIRTLRHHGRRLELLQDISKFQRSSKDCSIIFH